MKINGNIFLIIFITILQRVSELHIIFIAFFFAFNILIYMKYNKWNAISLQIIFVKCV